MGNKIKQKKKLKVFFAFPDHPIDRKNLILKSIETLNSNTSGNFLYNIIPWVSLNGSNNIMNEILGNINDCDIVVADLSDTNINVLFEIGYAFGKYKNTIFFMQDYSTKQKNIDLDNINFLTPLKIESYQNSEDIVDFFNLYKSNYSKKSPEINNYLNSKIVTSSEKFSAFILKGNKTNDIIKDGNNFIKSHFTDNLVIDDWEEDSSQNLRFYISTIYKSDYIFAYFVNKDWDDGYKSNSRFSFLCGMAYGMEKNILMVGVQGFDCPFDFKELIINPLVTKNLTTKMTEFISQRPSNNLSLISKNKPQKNQSSNLNNIEKQLVLIDICIGNPIAENEEEDLNEYYIETLHYKKALNSKQALIIGNKGTGKTALFFHLRDNFKNDKRNLVCELKPSEYKFNSIINSTIKLRSEKGYLTHIMENIWKTILFLNIFENIEIEKYKDNEDLINFINKYDFILNKPFEKKLEVICSYLDKCNGEADNFSKMLHDSILSNAKKVLQPILSNMKSVVFLIDNLDKSWECNSDFEIQSNLIFNLLGQYRKLYSEFGDKVNFATLIFLRRNIYDFIITNNNAREPDKLNMETIELEWTNTTQLFDIIEKRFRWALNDLNLNSNLTFMELFEEKDKEILYKKIVSLILPRPRDLIKFMERCIDSSYKSEHSVITNDDLEDAGCRYSGDALTELEAEYSSETPWLKKVLQAFYGETKYYSFRSISILLKKKIDSNYTQLDILGILKLLIDISFIGIKQDEKIIFAYNLENKKIANNYLESKYKSKDLCLIINPVFYRHMQIIDDRKSNNFQLIVKKIINIMLSI